MKTARKAVVTQLRCTVYEREQEVLAIAGVSALFHGRMNELFVDLLDQIKDLENGAPGGGNLAYRDIDDPYRTIFMTDLYRALLTFAHKIRKHECIHPDPEVSQYLHEMTDHLRERHSKCIHRNPESYAEES